MEDQVGLALFDALLVLDFDPHLWHVPELLKETVC